MAAKTIAELVSEKQSLQAEYQSRQANIAELRAALIDAESDIQRLSIEVSARERELHAATTLSEIQSATDDLRSTRAELEAANTLQANIKGALRRAENSLDSGAIGRLDRRIWSQCLADLVEQLVSENGELIRKIHAAASAARLSGPGEVKAALEAKRPGPAALADAIATLKAGLGL